ncbi:MAG: metalloregulator ArsR/SmtB family transcription factor [Thalassobaculaceae bacterium]|nr:metalloregulator ArsR/SmtB family transcription factor [Thalassobaculaceae bacterium]
MDTVKVVAALSALAQENRLGIFRLLVQTGTPGMSAGGIARELGIVASTLSHHLGLLEQAELVRSNRRGRNVIYTCNLDGVRTLLRFLIEDCCGGRAELCGDLGAVALGSAAQ